MRREQKGAVEWVDCLRLIKIGMLRVETEASVKDRHTMAFVTISLQPNCGRAVVI